MPGTVLCAKDIADAHMDSQRLALCTRLHRFKPDGVPPLNKKLSTIDSHWQRENQFSSMACHWEYHPHNRAGPMPPSCLPIQNELSGIFILDACRCMGIHAIAWRQVRGQLCGVSFLLLPCESWGLSLGNQAWLSITFSTEPSHWPIKLEF